MAHGEVVETTPAAVEHEDVMPCGWVELVAATRGQTNSDALTFWHSFPLAVWHVFIHTIKGDSTGSVVGIKVDGNLPTNPFLFWYWNRKIAGRIVVGQHHAFDEERIGVASCEEHVNTAIRRSAVGIGNDGFVKGVIGSRLDWWQNRAIAIAIITDAEKGTPPFAQLVTFDFDDSTIGEVEAVLGDVVGGNVAKARAGGV